MLITRSKFFLALLVAGLLSSLAYSQELARPGWAGFGTASQVWWKGASVYEIDPHGFGGLKGITAHLDYIHSLGTDAVLLTRFQSDAAHPQQIDPAIGTLDDLEELIHQASSRNMRILIDLGEPAPATDLTSIARYWLNQGVAGFHINSADQAAQLRKIASSYIGQRIVIGDLDPANPARQGGPQLLLDARLSKVNQLSAAALRAELEAVEPTQDLLLATDSPDTTRSITRLGDGAHNADIAKIVATLLFANHASALIYSGQELGLSAGEIQWGTPAATPAAKKHIPHVPEDALSVAAEESNPDSLLSWYRRLIALHHSNATISSAPATITLDHDSENVLAWIRKPQVPTYKNPPVVIVCNLSAQSVRLSLTDDMKKLHLRGSFLRPILRSDNGMGPMSLDAMMLAPFAIYIGGLGY